MTMRSLFLMPALCACAWLGACASDPNMQLAESAKPECKMVTVHTAADHWRYEREGIANVEAVRRTEAAGVASRVGSTAPHTFGAPPGNRLLAEAARNC
jgi:hypothetical protein